jgi:hypothetical protein
MEYLTPEDPKPGRFYLLPKIHKENNPGRPIVSANGHPTEKIWCHFGSHSCPIYLKIVISVKSKIVVF